MRLRKNSKKRGEHILGYFIVGVIILIIIQLIFMVGGFFLENYLDIPVSGLPSAIGLTIVLIICLLVYRKSEFVLLGSFTFAILVPLILLFIVLFEYMIIQKPEIYYSIGYMTLMILSIWIFYIIKILRMEF